MDDNPEISDRLNVNKSTYHNKRPGERFICFIRGAKWMKINQLNGPSPIHDTSTWLSQSIQSITHVCWACKKISLKVLQDSFRPLRFPVNKCFPANLTHGQTLPLAAEQFKRQYLAHGLKLNNKHNFTHFPPSRLPVFIYLNIFVKPGHRSHETWALDIFY